MSYTSEVLLGQYLSEGGPVLKAVTDQTLILDGSEYDRFFNGSVQDGSVRVKSPQLGRAVRSSVSLTGGSGTIAAAPLIPGSVLVASDSSLGTIYVENQDYIVDYPSGILTVKNGGQIAPQAAVVVWYRAYTLYTAGEDYSVREETVYIDYTPVAAAPDESLLRAAVLEANARIEKLVDPDRSFGADSVLQSAATYLALAAVARSSAAGSLQTDPSRDRTANAWLNLAAEYQEQSERLIKAFRAPKSGPASPAKS